MKRWLLLSLVAAAIACDVGNAGSLPSGADERPDDLAPARPSGPLCITSPARETLTGAACAANPPDTLDLALAKLSLTRCTLGLDDHDLTTSKLDARDPRMASRWHEIAAAPLSFPTYGATIERELRAAFASKSPVARAIAALAKERGTPVDTCLGAEILAVPDGSVPLADVLIDVMTKGRSADEVRAEVAAIPLELQRALVPIVREIIDANREIEAARAPSAAYLTELASVPSWILGVRHFFWSSELVASFESVDVDRIVASAARLALVVESADLARFRGAAFAPVLVETTFGSVVVRGSGDDVYGEPDCKAALLVDTGGDDVYRGAVGAAAIAPPVSIAIDLGGRDRYEYTEAAVPEDAQGSRLPSDGSGRIGEGRTLSRTGRQGSGVLGVGMLFDLGSEADTYRSLIGSQGAAAFGVGVLFDAGGDDTYEAEGFSQGAAAWGIGLLVDASGADSYALYNSGQGFGFSRGVGAIVDGSGDDAYVARAGDAAGDLIYPSDQLTGPPSSSVTANHSMSQGCGAGHRPDWPDPGFPFPGGTGLLFDMSGRDTYSAGVFAQGAGYVQGIGIFLDDAGDDTYEGLYYVQGAAAHQGQALFFDRGGADRYDPTFPIALSSIGLAHDFSIAVHFDAAGDDTYLAPALSLGTGLDNGIGVFVDTGGSDLFQGSSQGFGAALAADTAKGPRSSVPTTGIFVKAGGVGTYRIDGKNRARSGSDWGGENDDDESHDSKVTRAVGLDRPDGRVDFGLFFESRAGGSAGRATIPLWRSIEEREPPGRQERQGIAGACHRDRRAGIGGR